LASFVHQVSRHGRRRHVADRRDQPHQAVQAESKPRSRKAKCPIQ
jgi:hypothetical protein